jgi:transcription elongation factor S-II
LYDYKSEEYSEGYICKKAIEIEEAINENNKNESYYNNKATLITQNLKDNKELIMKLLSNKLKTNDLVLMEEKDLCSKEVQTLLKNEEKKQFESSQSNYSKPEVEEGIEQCRKCKGRKLKITEMQTRSADEPMTRFIECIECGNKWKD